MYEDIIPSDLVTRNFVNGIALILKYQTNARISIGQHDTIYFGEWNDDMLTKEDEQSMLTWGWYKENNCWAINV